METPPPSLDETAVASVVEEAWRLTVTSATYLAVGFGSQHWIVDEAGSQRWFVSGAALTAAEPEHALRRLAAALEVAVVASDAGCGFAVAPRRTWDGGLLAVASGHAMALYPFVAGRSGRFFDAFSTSEAEEMVDHLVRLHGLSPSLGRGVSVDPLEARGLGPLQALGALEVARGAPYAELVRALLAEHVAVICRALSRHDRLVATAGPQCTRLVLTHGEPHAGNVLRTSHGLRLVDWDTALLAPPERDLWLLDDRAPGSAAEYSARSGRILDQALMGRYRLAWALTDIALFSSDLMVQTQKSADAALCWEALEGTVKGLSTLLTETE